MIKAARIKFDKLKGETPKAFLVQIGSGEYWIPKSQCRKFTTNQKLGGHVELPTFIINRILDVDINEMEELPEIIKSSWVVEKHKPNAVEPLENNFINELKN